MGMPKSNDQAVTKPFSHNTIFSMYLGESIYIKLLDHKVVLCP